MTEETTKDRLDAAYRAGAEAAEAERDRLEAALRDFADWGLRADLNPTGVFSELGVFEPVGGWHAYLKRIDESVRERARAALTTEDQADDNR